MNPYKVLHISSQAPEKEVMQAVPIALKRKEFTAREIVDAQKELMNPQTRIVAEFIYLLGSQQWANDIKIADNQDDISDLPLLDIFDKFSNK